MVAALELLVGLPTVAWLVFVLVHSWSPLSPILLLWAAITALVELLPVPFWRGIQISTGFPLLMALAFLYGPSTAGLTAFVGAFDPREFKRDVSFLKALFNRSQITLSVVASSLVFHSLTSVDGGVIAQIGVATLATVADYLVNITCVTIYSV